MREMRNLFHRLKHFSAFRQGKQGSSLALVIMISAALMIWVMCILPLMTATGNAVYKTETSYDDYLFSRSVVEFCKSELKKIVEDQLPYTFAVTGDLENGFTAVAKWNENGLTVRPEYAALVDSPNSLDDRQDIPSSDTVIAICAAEPNLDNPNTYELVMTVYMNKEKTLTYTAVFTGEGSQMIFPEAYRQNQALPIGDFIVVDGKMGSNTVWNSTITMSNAQSLDFSETLLPWITPGSSEWSEFYANTGEYPAVFKTTANAAPGGNVNISDPVTMGEMTTDENWIRPTAKSGDSNSPGNIWFVEQNGKIQIKMYTNQTLDITSACTVYLNGRATYDLTVPESGIYKVSVDYMGTDYSTEENQNKYDPDRVNVLPINGLQLSENINKVVTGINTLDETVAVDDIEKVEHRDSKDNLIETTYNVTLTCPVDDLLYGIAGSDGKVTWSASNVFTELSGDAGSAYFFYVCRPATYVDGVFGIASDAKFVGMVYMPQFVSGLQDGGTYAIFGQTDSNYYQLKSDATPSEIKKDEDFMVSEQNIAADVWNVEVSRTSVALRNDNDQYLTITGEAVPKCANGSKAKHQHADSTYSCYKTKVSLDHFETTGLGFTDYGYFTFTRSSSNFSLYTKAVDESVEYPEWNCGNPINNSTLTTSFTDNRNSYLNMNGSASASYQNTPVKFMKAPPTAPVSVTVPCAEYTVDASVAYGTDVLDFVRNQLSDVELVALYANSQEVTGVLNAGVYHLVAKIMVDDLEMVVNLGNLTVTRVSLDGSQMTINAVCNETDELRVDVSATGWHTNGGIRYYGYKSVDETSYRWYVSNDEVYTFRLPYGTYNFAVMETGDHNYNGAEVVYGDPVELKPKPVSADKININEFTYTFDPNSGEVVWYRLPEELIPNRVSLVFGYYWEEESEDLGKNSDLRWDTEYSPTKDFEYSGATHTYRQSYYGVIIEGTDYFDLDHVFRISQPVTINTTNGHTSSMMRGSSLYFMGRDSSINTCGTDIYLTTDLLVLYADVTGGGSVKVQSFSTGGGRPGGILFFVANPGGIVRGGQTIFEGRTFYQIPENTDLCNLNAGTTKDWKLGDIYDEDVRYLFRLGVYPEINPDIAYAGTEQISSIISSETIGWTVDGVLSGSSTVANSGYAVTVYVTGMNGEADYKANRILIAAHSDSSKTLDVSSDLSLTTRYLSVDADQIVGKGTKFILNNLAQDQDFVRWICSDLELTNYSSRTLQVDYKRNTMIMNNGLATQILKQICRYENGTNLLSQVESMPPAVEYTTSEIDNLFTNGLVSSDSDPIVKIVDRYVSLTADKADGNISTMSWLVGSELHINANYVYFDSSVKEIDMSHWFEGSDIRISSQESGYSPQEYLGYFKGNSAESYNGTILYFSSTVRINLGDSVRTVSPGFYWIDATDDGTSLTILANNPQNYKIAPEALKNHSIYINPDGSLGNAYIGTGLEGVNSATVGGFSGGSIE